MNTLSRGIVTTIAMAGLGACNSGSSPPKSEDLRNRITSASLEADAFGNAPLSGKLHVRLLRPGDLRIILRGRNGPQSDLTIEVDEGATNLTVPLVGFYAGHLNEVKVELREQGVVLDSENVTYATPSLPTQFPTFDILHDYADDEQAFFLVNFRPYQRPLIVDRYGHIRWYLSARADYGLQVLRNGNIGFGIENRIEEYSLLGELKSTWDVGPDFENIHHDVFELGNGNFLATVNRVGIETIEDFIIEIDRETGTVLTVWDLRDVLPRRNTFIEDASDWFHANAVIHDDRDDSIIVSGQRQGLVKVTRSNELRWILSQPDGWTGFENFLLMPSGTGSYEPIWGQHAPLILPDGDILLFDNGFGREYGSGARYSRAVRFRIVENPGGGGSVEQIWQYGKERGEDLYSPIISDVDYLTDENAVLITAGSVAFEVTYVSASNIPIQWIQQTDRARIVQVDFQGSVQFEMRVVSPILTASVYRSEKIDFAALLQQMN